MRENITRETCRLCSSKLSDTIISLGDQYINDFLEDVTLKGRNGKCPVEKTTRKPCF